MLPPPFRVPSENKCIARLRAMADGVMADGRGGGGVGKKESAMADDKMSARAGQALNLAEAVTTLL